MKPTSRGRAAAAALVVAALAGGGAGAAIYATTAGTQTRVVTQAAPVAATPVAQTGSELSVGQIYARSAAGVVEVDASANVGYAQPYPYGQGGSQQQAQGTGFVYDDAGHIVTNAHVVDGATSVSVKLSDGSTYKASVVGTDASTDLAVLKVNAPAAKLRPLVLGDSSKVAVGEGVVAIGNPFGLDNSVTSGIVSAVGREISAPNNDAIENAIQTDAAINHGNSGGPLFDLQGKVIGVTAQIASDTGGNDGVGFAIPSNTVASVASQLIASGRAQHALLGVSVQSAANGVRIGSVRSGSAAADAGVKAGDVVTAFNGAKVTTPQQLRGLIDVRKPGDKVSLTILRNGSSRILHVTLGTRA
jgi:putative serine protease PepD